MRDTFLPEVKLMRTLIQSIDFPLTKALKTFILCHAEKNALLHTERVKSVIVRLKDLNGPKGGADKQCIVEVQLSNLPPIVVKRCSLDAYASARHALARASRIVNRRLGRQRAARLSVTSTPN